MELRLQPMPSQAEWSAATKGAAELLGVSASPFLTPQAVATLAELVHAEARKVTAPAQQLVGELERAYHRLGLPVDAAVRTADRLATARRAATIAASLQQLQGVELVKRLGVEVEDGRGNALGTSLKQAGAVVAAFERFRWERLDPLKSAETDEDAQRVLSRLKTDLTSDEFVARAAEALQRADNEAFEWALTIKPVPTPPIQPPVPRPGGDDPEVVPLPPGPEPRPVHDPSLHRVTRIPGGDGEEILTGLREFLRAHEGKRVEVTWRVVE